MDVNDGGLGAHSPTVLSIPPDMSTFLSGGLQDNGSGIRQDAQDSITLGQLKAMVGSAPKPKVLVNSNHCQTFILHFNVLAMVV